MNREEAAAKAIFDIRDDAYDSTDWVEANSTERELPMCQARAALAAAELHDAENNVFRYTLDEATLERMARAICAAEFPAVNADYAWNVQFEDGQNHYRTLALGAAKALAG